LDIEKASRLLGDDIDSGTAETMSEIYPDISEYTRDDFLNSEKPYEFLYMFKDDKFKQKRLLAEMTDQAKKCKVTNFPTLYKAFAESRKDVADDLGNYTNFPLQPVTLPCGKWVCDASGVRTQGEKGGLVWACPHPIMPVARYTNIDTGEEKIKLAYFKGKYWRELIVDRTTISVANKITELSKPGVVVTSETARNLVNYLYDVEQLSGNLLPEVECVTRLGWIKRGEETEFAPYTDGLTFDGEVEYKKRYESVKRRGKPGDWDKWIEFINKNIRRNSVAARMVFAASLASVLVRPLGCNCFWVHLWGETESAKTVLAMCAASCWGNPELGAYISTFNSTYVGMEKTAAFYNSLPYIVDELQIVDSRREMDNTIYMLTEGCGRTRGNKMGGIDNTSEWRNCVISTGERPINSSRSGGGSVNRVIEIECKDKFFGDDSRPEFDSPRDVANFVKSVYGFFGQMFVNEIMSEDVMERLEEKFKAFSDELVRQYNIAQKQAQSGALILTADWLITENYLDGPALTAADIAPYLKSKDDVSVNKRAYEYVCEYITQNQNKFGLTEKNMEVWGEFCDDTVYIIKLKFEQICSEGGFNPASLLSWLADRGLIRRTDKKHMTVLKKIGSVPTRCVHLTMPSENADEADSSAVDEYPDF
jgi:hypothetical protein